MESILRILMVGSIALAGSMMIIKGFEAVSFQLPEVTQALIGVLVTTVAIKLTKVYN